MDRPTLQNRIVALVDAIENPRVHGRIDAWTIVYTTTGGSRMIASPANANDDDRPHDLVLVHPAPMNGDHMVVLRPNVDPEWSTALRAALAARREPQQDARPCRHEESLYGRCTRCGMTWGEQERARAEQKG